MSTFILVSGTIFREPQQRTSQSGKRYVIATLRATTTDNSSSDFWSIMCFSESAGAELLRLGLNEKLAVQGSLKLETFTKDGETKISRTIFVDHVLALRAPPREKKPKAKAAATSQENTAATTDPPFDDSIPF
jgi:single-stranded DNA-binding protein